jgi:hypothetical protein
VSEVRRGRRDDREGSILLSVSGDGASSQYVGYKFVYLDGQCPLNFAMPKGAWVPLLMTTGPHLALDWEDGGTRYQDAFSFRMFVIAVDYTGNESAPSNILVVAHDGKPDKK